MPGGLDPAGVCLAGVGGAGKHLTLLFLEPETQTVTQDWDGR